MNETEWLTCVRPAELIAALHRQNSARKWRLFAIDCVRCLWHLLPPPFRVSIEMAERFVDRRATVNELAEVWVPYRSSFSFAQRRRLLGVESVGDIITRARVIIPYLVDNALTVAEGEQVLDGLHRHQCDVLRDIFGNPFRTVQLDPEWLRWGDHTAAKLARAIHEEQTLDQLPVLADALEDAGCRDELLLDHLRNAKHTRGCWALDLLTGRGGV